MLCECNGPLGLVNDPAKSYVIKQSAYVLTLTLRALDTHKAQHFLAHTYFPQLLVIFLNPSKIPFRLWDVIQ